MKRDYIMARPKKAPPTTTTTNDKDSPPTGGTVYGYARVSTADQAEKYGLDIQVKALTEQGKVLPENIFSDNLSGANRTRENLNLLLDTLKSGDTIIVTRIDRLARDTLHLLQLAEDWNARGVKFKSLSEDIDTTTEKGYFFFTLTCAMARLERNTIKERTYAGLLEFKKEHGRWGRIGVGAERLQAIREELISGKTHKQLALTTGISKSTLYKHFPPRDIEQWRDERLKQQNAENLDMFAD